MKPSDKDVASAIKKANSLLQFFPWSVGQTVGERGYRAFREEIIDGMPTGDSVECSEEFPTIREAQAYCDERNGGNIYEAMRRLVGDEGHA